MTGPTDPRSNPDSQAEPVFRPDAEMEHTPRRKRQPALTVLAILGVLLLVLALAIFGGIF